MTPLELRRQGERCSLAALSDVQMQQLAAASQRCGYPLKGNLWLEPGMRDAVLLVTEGRFRIQRGSRHTPRLGFCQFAYPGDLIGVSRLGRDPQPTEIFAEKRRGTPEKTRAIAMPSSLLSAFFDQNRDFARALLRELQTATDELAEEIAGLRCHTFAERALARIERRLGRNSGELDWSQEDLALLAGGTRSDVSRELGPLTPHLQWGGRLGKLIVTDLSAARRQIAHRRGPRVAIDSGSANAGVSPRED